MSNTRLYIDGQEAKYEGKKTFIEKLNEDETCVIRNPDWDWDEEAECVNSEIDYDIPYWITVNISDLQ
jgi:hypothetical protein